MSRNEYRDLAVEQFWGGDNDSIDRQCRGAQVISYLKEELRVVEEAMEENEEDDDTPDGQLRKALLEVINWVCDISENEDLRVE